MRWRLATVTAAVAATCVLGVAGATLAPSLPPLPFGAVVVPGTADAPTIAVAAAPPTLPTDLSSLLPDDLLLSYLDEVAPEAPGEVVLVRGSATLATAPIVRPPATHRPERAEVPFLPHERAAFREPAAAPAPLLVPEQEHATPAIVVATPHTTRGAALATATALAGALALLGGLALYHRIRPNTALENETRKVIFDAVQQTPGLGVHAIAQTANVSYSTAVYHLERLIGAGMIVMTPNGNKLCYYKNGGSFTETERRLLPILKNDEAARLLDAILATPGTYRAELAERLGVTATTINWHLKRLRDAGLVRELRQGRNAYLFVDVASMTHTMGSLVQKVPQGELAVLERLRRYAQAGNGTAST